MKSLQQLRFENHYASLPEICLSGHSPQPLENARLVHFNADAAALIDLDPGQANTPEFLDFVSGKQLLPDCQPLAMCYAGHQFGQYVPRLGDGRAILLGQVRNDDGQSWDLQLKGGGKTLYSRGGDGRAVLRSTIREYLCSEAMHGLGIPTTRALCLIDSDEEVYREQIETGAMLVRMAPTHIRFGSFEYLYYEERHDDLRALADYTLKHYFPDLVESDNPFLALLETAIASTANLIAQWQAVGFAHGVMNSDNMSMLGLTLDYGPFGFLDAYDPGFICNHSDHSGRYAFDQQPHIGLFNLSCLAQALLPLIDTQAETSAALAREALDRYQALYIDAYAERMREKLGLQTARPEDKELCETLLGVMASCRADYTRVFRQLSEPNGLETLRDLFTDRDAIDTWLRHYRARLEHEKCVPEARSQRMKQVNPKYILRNYLAENAIRKARDEQDFSEIGRLMTLLKNPFDDNPEFDHYAAEPPDWAQGISVSCSS
ncbi:uncharacterized protein YdiU (UPF0061 family) [Thiogranum longum]|uniref:Protein nucleotidyltransferase YdiU n=1 Tax=Thiogranum longum TaxID=1537524 RepID=A0A4R1HKN5_9GAMM|nr:YdiU family protein [Thiogranum longum]TCK17762.1 uncharacterized protein YdiU (UPF0061 family) [Thiogranum longum]